MDDPRRERGWSDQDRQDAGDPDLGRGAFSSRDYGARMDPALQDFFASTDPREAGMGPDQRSRPGGPGGDPASQGAPGRRAPRSGRGDGGERGDRRSASRSASDDEAGGGKRLVIIGGVVLVVVVAIGAYLVLGKSKSSNSAATATQPMTSSSAPAPAASKGGSGKPTSQPTQMTAYTLSTPATAAGYPQGQDPNFLANATATAKGISDAVVNGGAGNVTGSPVSAAYQLPIASQVMTFVGYQGTFTPAKVIAALKPLGSDENSYPAGSHGGDLVCYTTPGAQGTAAGTVCVWATTSTLGVVEFYSATAPEVLTTHQYKGAQDTVSMRSDVEAAKSSLSSMPSPTGIRKLS